MKRERFLWPLTHGHQRGLMAAKNLKARLQGPGEDREKMEGLRADVREFFDLELRPHFRAEETLFQLFSRYVGEKDGDLVRLKGDHRTLEQLARKGFREDLRRFADLLVKHIRHEEEAVFGRIEKALTPLEAVEAAESMPPAPAVCPRLLSPGKN